MAHIHIDKGLDIPIEGIPRGGVKALIPNGQLAPSLPPQIALDLSPFSAMSFTVLVQVGDQVQKGQPLVEDKSCTGRYFVAPTSGSVKEIRRGIKRRLMTIVIEADGKEENYSLPSFDWQRASVDNLVERLKASGLFAHIHTRPLSRLAHPHLPPRAIFIKAIESAPFVPPAEMQVEGHEREFQAGLNALKKLTKGPVHLVYRHDTSFKAFKEAQNVEKHTAKGPHPIGTFSLHIQRISPIRSSDEIVWVLNAHQVVAIGHLLLHNTVYTDRVIGIGGCGLLENQGGFFRIQEGYPISTLVDGRLKKGIQRIISGDPLNGTQVEGDAFLGFEDYALSVFPENTDREMLHFFRLGSDKFSYTKAYLSGHHTPNPDHPYFFTTSQHGEHRPFIDSSPYDRVMPLHIPVVPLVKAVMAEDFELAEALGLLEVDPEDFALASFICPSKMELPSIIREGMGKYAKDRLARMA